MTLREHDTDIGYLPSPPKLGWGLRDEMEKGKVKMKRSKRKPQLNFAQKKYLLFNSNPGTKL